MRISPVPAPELQRAYDGLVARYDSDRNAILRTLYAWFNLTLLLSFAWPALVVFFEAPLASVESTPLDWYLLRIAAPLAVLVVGMRLWWASGVPLYVALPQRTDELRQLGPIWTQVFLFVFLLSIALSAVLLFSDPTAAFKVLVFGLVEAAALQVIIPGYVKTTLEAMEAQPSRIFWICVALFAVTFALRGGLAAAIQPDSVSSVVAGATIAGGVAGAVIGAAFTYLRDRTGSLLPGIILQWLIVALIPAVAG